MLIFSLFLPLFVTGQNCPSVKTVAGYVVIQLSKKFDTVMIHANNKDNGYLMPAYHPSRTWVVFVPQDSITSSRPLSFWIDNESTLPALYSLWNEGALRRVLNERCGIRYRSLDLTYAYPYPQASTAQVTLYELDGAEKEKWYYLIYYLKADWWYTLLTEADKKQFTFGSNINPAPPDTGATPYFGIKEVLEYTIEASFEDARLHPYQLTVKN